MTDVANPVVTVEYRCQHAVAKGPILALVRCPEGCIMWVRQEPVYPLRLVLQ